MRRPEVFSFSMIVYADSEQKGFFGRPPAADCFDERYSNLCVMSLISYIYSLGFICLQFLDYSWARCTLRFSYCTCLHPATLTYLYANCSLLVHSLGFFLWLQLVHFSSPCANCSFFVHNLHFWLHVPASEHLVHLVHHSLPVCAFVTVCQSVSRRQSRAPQGDWSPNLLL